MTVASIMQASRTKSAAASPTQISGGLCNFDRPTTLNGREIPSIVLPPEQAVGDIQYLHRQYTGIHIIGLPRDLSAGDFIDLLKPFGKFEGKVNWKSGQTWATINFANAKKAEEARFQLANESVKGQAITVGFDLSTGKSAASETLNTGTSSC